MLVWFLQHKLHVQEKNLLPKIKPHITKADYQEVLRCLNDSKTLEETVHNAEPYLYPFEMEFCLTAVGLLFIMMTKRTMDATAHGI
mgnify:FL=1